jgi:hypothetical protein
MSWKRLVERNDWESITVHIGGPVVRGTNLPLEKCPLALKAGEYKVRWSNGVAETLTVIMKPYTEVYGDMGHDYEAYGEKPYFQFVHNGTKQSVYAPKLNVEVWDETD